MSVTPLYAGLLGLLYLLLSYRVVQSRGHGRPSLGDGGDEALLRRIRGHGNFAEYVPFILLLIGILELNHLPVHFLHALGATLLVARLLHGYALSFTDSFKFGRFWGTLLTFILLLVTSLLCLYQAAMTQYLSAQVA